MKLALVLLLACLCAAAVSADVAVWQKQEHVLLLLSHINQPHVYKDHVKIAESFNITKYVSDYSKPEAVHEAELYLQYGYLPQGEIFSVMNEEHLRQAIVVFNLFYYAKTYETFYQTAVYAKHYLNEGLFLYAYSVAVVHRPDMQDVILPPIYEIYPYYFYNVETIQEAYLLKQAHNTHHPVQGYDEHLGYTVFANYSGHYLNLHPEQSMSYYLEDVGINAFYYYYNLYYPFWMSSTEYGSYRGVEYFYFYQQLLARYYLERISNNLGEIPYFNWEVPVETSYYPSLEYPNGLEFPYRPPFANLYEYFYNYGQHWTFTSSYGYSYSLIHDWEQRINDAIDLGYVYHHGQKVDLYTPDGLNILGNIIESNPDSPNQQYYGYLWLYARHLLGYSFQPLDKYHLVPSALEHFETSLRDPMFYQLYKKLWMKFYRYLYHYPSYTPHDLIFPGVEVVNVQTDKLVTYHELFYSDLSNAVYYSEDELLQDSFHVHVVQERLNHKPFDYKITVKSDHVTKAVVKIFIAPLYDEYHRYINISENQMNMVLLDYFIYNLTAGENVIVRNSHDTHLYGLDALSYYDIYKQMKAANGAKEEWEVHQNYYSFPHRYMLPTGSHNGVPYQFYVFVYPYVPTQVQETALYYSYFYPYEGEHQYFDHYSLGYPFDRPIHHEYIWNHIPNSYVYEALIYHTEDVVHHGQH